jgi:hypothetical protein
MDRASVPVVANTGQKLRGLGRQLHCASIQPGTIIKSVTQLVHLVQRIRTTAYSYNSVFVQGSCL